MRPRAGDRGRASGSDLATRVAELRTAVETAQGRLPETVLAPAREVLARAGERSELSAEHTVVALAGATGAGKSSVFNALTGAELARTSTRRPTTAHALAVVAERPELAPGSAELLEWLGVPSRHDVPVTEHHPDGLVLLDLPDHDSVISEHRLRADHVTERADLLVWITNPQKYADAVLHTRYLAPLAGREGTVLVVLNQVDRLTQQETAECLADLERLVRRDGLDAQVLATSAHTGAGIAQLREVVTRAVARRQAATARLVAEVRGAATSLVAALPAVADGTRAVSSARTGLVDALEQAAGVPLVVEAVRGSALRDAVAHTGWPPTRWVQRLRADPLRTLGLRGSSGHGPGGTTAEPTSEGGLPSVRRTSLPTASPAVRARLASAARAYVAASGAALPGGWGERVNGRVVEGVGGIADALDAAVGGSVTVRDPRWWRAVGWLQWLFTATLVVGLLWLAVLAALDYLQLPVLAPPVVTVGRLEWPWPSLLAIGGAAAGILLAALSRLFARAGANHRARAVHATLRRAVERVAADRLLREVDGELAAVATMREAARRAAA